MIVSVRGSGAKSGQAVNPGDEVSAGETLMVDEGSAVVVRLKDRAALQIRNASKLIFQEIGDTVHLSLDYGSALSVVRADYAKTKKFTLVTPAASVGVRGTTFYAESRGLDEVYLCLCAGEISVETRTSTETLQTPAGIHRAATVLPDKSGNFTFTPSKRLNHSEEEIALLQRVLHGRR